MRLGGAGAVDGVVAAGAAVAGVVLDVGAGPAVGVGAGVDGAAAGVPGACWEEAALRLSAAVAASAAVDPDASCCVVGVAAAALMRVMGVRVAEVATRATRQAARVATPAPARPSWRGRTGAVWALAEAGMPGQNAQRPNSMVAAGTSRDRTTKVSMSTPTVTPKPIWRSSGSGAKISAAKVPARMSPAEVMVRPVAMRP